ncbi:MAG: hypothetical protein QOF79_1670 [Actinomycetota bacterium]|nr:hypothetical protein [Actinomycetota bacterium]
MTKVSRRRLLLVSDTSATGGTASGIAAGWYTDPYDPRQLRWWDGNGWTEHVTAPTVPVEAEATQPAEAVEPVEAVQPTEAAPVVEESAVEPSPAEAAAAEAPADASADSGAFPSRRALREGTAEPVQAQPVQPVQPVQPEPVPAVEEAPLPLQSPPPLSAWDQPAAPTFTDESEAVSAGDVSTVPDTTVPDATFPDTTLPDAASAAANAEPSAAPWTLAPSASTGTSTGGSTGRRASAHPRPEGSMTAWVWFVAGSPLIAAATIGYVLASQGFSSAGWMLPVSALAPYLLGILFAAGDNSRLRAVGHNRPASFGWAALTAPVYLLMRANALRREGSSGNLPIILWFVFFVIAIAGLVGYGLITGQPLVPGLPGA